MNTINSFFDELEKLSSVSYECKVCGYKSSKPIVRCPRCGSTKIKQVGKLNYIPTDYGGESAVSPESARKKKMKDAAKDKQVPEGPPSGEEMTKRTKEK